MEVEWRCRTLWAANSGSGCGARLPWRETDWGCATRRCARAREIDARDGKLLTKCHADLGHENLWHAELDDTFLCFVLVTFVRLRSRVLKEQALRCDITFRAS